MRRAARVARDAARALARDAFALGDASARAHASSATRALADRAAPSRATARDVSVSTPFARRLSAASASLGRKTSSARSRAPMSAEEMGFTRVVAVTDSKQRMPPTEGTLYGAPPKTWEEMELENVDAGELAKLDALFESYSEGDYVEGSGLPTYEEALAGAESARADGGAGASGEAGTDEADEADEDEREDGPVVRVPIIDAAGRSYGTGRRKTAVARVWLAPGAGEHKVNGRPYDEYFQSPTLRGEMLAPFFVSETLGLFSAVVDVRGGGISGQAQACRHGISVALQNYDPAFRPALKAAGYLTRDARIVERKKPGKAKARKSFAWVKR